MTVLFVIAIFMGTILGLHFKVLILVPTLGAVAVGMVVIGLADGFSLRDTALADFSLSPRCNSDTLEALPLTYAIGIRSQRPRRYRPLALTRN
jgi:hypothetical protein